LVLGGTGFIGRNFVEFLVKNDICSFLRVADKVLPVTGYLSSEQQKIFEKVDFAQKKLNDPVQIESTFKLDAGSFDYVFNLAAETRYGLEENVYSELVHDVSVRCAQAAAKAGVKKYVEVSTAQVYVPDKKPKSEEGKLEPWTTIAKFKLKAEEEIKKIPNLNWNIVRPAIVYGPGDKLGLAPRLIIGAVYKHQNEKMKFLYGGELRINTVHVRDVCRALLLIAEKAAPKSIFNLADKNDTDQEKVNQLLEKLYHIKTGYTSKLASMMTGVVSLKMVADTVNDKHVQPWVAMCKEENIQYTPISPYLDPELLLDKSLCIDGSAVEKLGFKYEHPHVTEELLRESIDYWVKQNLFPKKPFA